MILDEIRKEALRLMFVTYDDDLDAEGWNTDMCANETYLQYLRNMRGCINRCFGVFEREQCLPLKQLVVKWSHEDNALSQQSGNIVTIGTAVGTTEEAAQSALGLSIGKHILKVDLSVVAPDCVSIDRIITETPHGYEDNTDYKVDGNTLVLINRGNNAVITILYDRHIPRITSAMSYSTDIDLPDYLCELIPYYIKAELYEEDEPQMAVTARNYFEVGLERVKRKDVVQKRVEDVFWGAL